MYEKVAGNSLEVEKYRYRVKPSRPWKRVVEVSDPVDGTPIKLEFSATGRNVMVWSGWRLIGEFTVHKNDNR